MIEFNGAYNGSEKFAPGLRFGFFPSMAMGWTVSEEDFFQDNKLLKGEVEIGDYTVDLSNVTIPVLNVFAEQDHLVPPDASRALKEHVGSRDYTELSFPGGHIGIYVSGRARKEVPPTIGDWLKERM